MPFRHIFKRGARPSGLKAALFPTARADGPTRESAGALLDVFFRIITFAEKKKFKQLAGKIFVRGLCSAEISIEIDEHGGVLSHPQNQIRPRAVPFFAKEVVLLIEKVGAADFFETGGKVPVKKKGQLFTGRSRWLGHLLQPPPTQFGDLAYLGGLKILLNCFFGLCLVLS